MSESRSVPGWRAMAAAGGLAAAALAWAPGTASAEALLEGDIVITDLTNDAVLRIDPATGQTTIVSQFGNFFAPRGLIVDRGGFVFVADSASESVTRVEPANGGFQATVAAGIPFLGLRDVVIDSDDTVPIADRLLVIDPFLQAIFDVDPVNSRVLLGYDGSPVGDPVEEPFFRFASGLAREPFSGDIFVADPGIGGSGLHRWDRSTGELVAISRDGHFLQVEDVAIEGNCPCEPGANSSGGACRDQDPLVSSCTQACTLVVVDAAVPGIFRVDPCVPFNAADPEPNQIRVDVPGGTFVLPSAIAVEADGNILVTDPLSSAVFRFAIDSQGVGTQQTPITSPDITTPWGIAVVPPLDPFQPTDFLLIDTEALTLYRVDPDAVTPDPERVIVSMDQAFVRPVGIALDSLGHVIITDQGDPDAVPPIDPALIRVDPATGIQEVISAGMLLQTPTGVVVDAGGDYLVADPDAGAVIRVRPVPGGLPEQELVEPAAGEVNLLVRPVGVALDPDGILIVADDSAVDGFSTLRGVIRVNPVTGSQAVFPSAAAYGQPVAIAIDARGDYLVADRLAHTIFRVNPRSGAGAVQAVGVLMHDLQGIGVDLNRDMLVTTAGDPDSMPAIDAAVVRVDAISKIESDVPAAGTLGVPAGIVVLAGLAPPALNDEDEDAWGEGDDNCIEEADADQRDTNSDGVGNLCDQDYDGDGMVGFSDRALLSPAFGSVLGDDEYRPDLDANGDEAIDEFEFEKLLASLGCPPGPSGRCTGTSDACPLAPDPNEPPCTPLELQDEDGDGWGDVEDNCIKDANFDQRDTDSDGIGNLCDCDFNNDGGCGQPDYSILLSCFNKETGPGTGPEDDPTCEASDMNGDGGVGQPDYSLFLRLFGGPPGPSGRCDGTNIACPLP